MKKAFAAILAILYLSTSMGATLHFHYCMGKLVSWGLVDHKGGLCEFCGMQKKAFETGSGSGKTVQNNCCTEKQQHISAGGDQKAGADLSGLLTFFPADRPAVHIRLADGYPMLAIPERPVANAPPGVGLQPVFLLCCNFRI